MKQGSKCYSLALRNFSAVRFGELEEATICTKELLFLEEQKKIKEAMQKNNFGDM